MNFQPISQEARTKFIASAKSIYVNQFNALEQAHNLGIDINKLIFIRMLYQRGVLQS